MPIIRDFKENFLERLDGLNAAQKTDFDRIKELLSNTPAGAKFIGNQALLAQSTTRPADILKDPAGAALNAASRAAGTAAQIGAILGQVRVNGTGTHFLMDETGLNTYLGITTAAAQAKYTGKISIKVPRKERNAKYTLDQRFNTIPEPGVLDVNEQLPEGEIDLSKEFDLVPVIFSSKTATDNGVRLYFRGIIDGLNDSLTGNWSNVDYVGRAEPLYTYQGFTRTLSFNLQVPIFKDVDQAKVYDKLNALASFLAPTYYDYRIPQGVFTRLTIGDLINTYGVMTSVTFDYQNDVPWSKPEGGDLLLPQVVNVGIGMNVIQRTVPTSSDSDNRSRQFIATKPLRGNVTSEQVQENGQV